MCKETPPGNYLLLGDDTAGHAENTIRAAGICALPGKRYAQLIQKQTMWTMWVLASGLHMGANESFLLGRPRHMQESFGGPLMVQNPTEATHRPKPVNW